jgi:hypothetical protein
MLGNIEKILDLRLGVIFIIVEIEWYLASQELYGAFWILQSFPKNLNKKFLKKTPRKALKKTYKIHSKNTPFISL